MKKQMTQEEFVSSMKALESRLDSYADLLINYAMRVKEGQEFVLQAPLEGADFARQLVAKAYEAGAKRVHIMWHDDELDRTAFEYESLDTIGELPLWKQDFYNDLAEKGAAFLSLTGSDPSHLDGISREKIALSQKTKVVACKIWRKRLDFGQNAWTIAGVPTKRWAEKVFPDLDDKTAYVKLWEAILNAGRIGKDARSEWETHTATLHKNVKFLNRHHFKELHYTSSNGTDLTIGLAPEGIWEGGPMLKQDGGIFYPNVPTEEVFTSPHAAKTQGTVHSALPLAHGGAVVKDFWFTFKDGKVVDYGAAEGKEVLTAILEADEGAMRLGEVALISKNTPIRESGLLIYNTLYDENASCHLALGKGFPECYENGYELSVEELSEMGLNQSTQHVDFMVGASDLNIVGITEDGEEVQVFENGMWAWE